MREVPAEVVAEFEQSLEAEAIAWEEAIERAFRQKGDGQESFSKGNQDVPTRMLLVESIDKDMLIVKSSGGSKKAARTQTKYTVNKATKILVTAKAARKKVKGGTTPGTRADLKQGAKVVIVAKGDVAEQVTIIPDAKSKKKS